MTLHITNGDSAATLLLQTGIEGRVLPWRDILHDGPVPAGLLDEELRKVRAQFISDQGWGGYESVLAEFEKRDLVLENIDEHDPIILWFEHDLYDQLQLIQILDRLGLLFGDFGLAVLRGGDAERDQQTTEGEAEHAAPAVGWAGEFADSTIIR